MATNKKMFSSGNLEVSGGTTKWLTYNNIRVQGSYEYRACIIFDKLKEKGMILDWSKSKLRIPYIGEDNKKHSYLVDFDILTNSNKILRVETKGYVQPKDLLKWKAAREQSHKILVFMGKHLDQIENKLKI